MSIIPIFSAKETTTFCLDGMITSSDREKIIIATSILHLYTLKLSKVKDFSHQYKDWKITETIC